MPKTYEQRVSQIHSVDDIQKQMTLAKSEMMRYRNRSKKAEMLKDKIEFSQLAKQAERVLWNLRRNVFDLAISDENPRPIGRG